MKSCLALAQPPSSKVQASSARKGRREIWDHRIWEAFLLQSQLWGKEPEIMYVYLFSTQISIAKPPHSGLPVPSCIASGTGNSLYYTAAHTFLKSSVRNFLLEIIWDAHKHMGSRTFTDILFRLAGYEKRCKSPHIEDIHTMQLSEIMSSKNVW